MSNDQNIFTTHVPDSCGPSAVINCLRFLGKEAPSLGQLVRWVRKERTALERRTVDSNAWSTKEAADCLAVCGVACAYVPFPPYTHNQPHEYLKALLNGATDGGYLLSYFIRFEGKVLPHVVLCDGFDETAYLCVDSMYGGRRTRVLYGPVAKSENEPGLFSSAVMIFPGQKLCR